MEHLENQNRTHAKRQNASKQVSMQGTHNRLSDQDNETRTDTKTIRKTSIYLGTTHGHEGNKEIFQIL